MSSPIPTASFLLKIATTAPTALNTLLTNFYKEGSEIPFFVAIGLGVCAVGAVVDCDIDQIVIICVMNAFGAATAVIE